MKGKFLLISVAAITAFNYWFIFSDHTIPYNCDDHEIKKEIVSIFSKSIADEGYNLRKIKVLNISKITDNRLNKECRVEFLTINNEGETEIINKLFTIEYEEKEKMFYIEIE